MFRSVFNRGFVSTFVGDCLYSRQSVSRYHLLFQFVQSLLLLALVVVESSVAVYRTQPTNQTQH